MVYIEGLEYFVKLLFDEWICRKKCVTSGMNEGGMTTVQSIGLPVCMQD